MKFAYPDMLFLLWVVAIAMGLTIYGIRKQKQIISNFASKASLHSISPRISFTRKWIKGLLLILALLFLCVSISGPLIGFKWKKIEQKGVDIMIALDCSRSMLCQDIKPSRLKRAKREIIDLLRIMKSDRAGLVAFAGRAILQCPLTLDHSAFNIFLDVLEPDYLPVGGTDIAGAITTCLNSFETDTNSSKAIILITDGENTSDSSVKEIVKKAAETGVKIFCIGMGSEDGAPIPDKNGGFKKDNNKDMIISKVDEKGLKELAALGNGKYVRSVTGDMDLDLIYSQGIRQEMEKKTLKSFRQKVWENRFQWFLLPCIMLLLAELLISREKKGNNLLMILIVMFTFSMFNTSLSYAGIGTKIGVGSDTKEGIKAFEEKNFEKAEKKFIDAQLKDPDNPKHYYNIGTAAYKNQDYDSALKNFQKALENENHDIKAELKHKILFNIGNTKYHQGDLKDAISDFEKVVKEYPSDNLAKENLEFIKKKLEQQKKQEQQDKNNKKDKNKKKNSDKDKKDNKDQNKDQNKDKDQEKNKKKGQDKDKKPDNVNKKSEKKPEDKQKKEPQEQQKNESGKQNKKQDKDDKAKQSKQNMLNRLSDKPGKAMMPVFQKQVIEKDW
ncbi:MAG: VWA domain-containing protein [Desulfobacteraceae bacterium]|nr:VWA domain-containing protein [Desulfobacteraceae bacterium]